MKLEKCLLRLVVLSVFFLCFTMTSVEARNGKFGVRAGLYTDIGDAFIGGEYLTPISKSVYFNPNLEYILVDNANFLTFNFDSHYDFQRQGNVFPWIGGGLGILYVNPDGPVDSETDLGLNLLFGLGFKTASSLIPYVQAKAVFSDNDEFVLGFGMRF
ncbi:MAG: hypothetical protein GWN62_06440 [Aliifodinibius sp.]|nr:hypothetical protein [Fodinibius sp.]